MIRKITTNRSIDRSKTALIMVLLLLLIAPLSAQESETVDAEFFPLVRYLKSGYFLNPDMIHSLIPGEMKSLRRNRYQFFDEEGEIVAELKRRPGNAYFDYWTTAPTNLIQQRLLELNMTQQTRAVAANNQFIWSYEGLSDKGATFYLKIYDCSKDTESQCKKRLTIEQSWSTDKGIRWMIDRG